MFKRIVRQLNKRGIILPTVILFLIVLIILILAMTYISYRRFLVSIHSVKNDFILTSALNLAYYDLFTGRYQQGRGSSNYYYESPWSGTGPYRVVYRIPLEVKENTIGGSCSGHNLSGSNNCISEGDFAKYMPVEVIYDPSINDGPQLRLRLLSRRPVDY